MTTGHTDTDRLPHYRVHGEGPTTLFMLHGAYGDSRYFDDAIARYVGDGLRVVAWTCPGYGPESVPDAFSVPLLAEYAANMVRREATERNVVLGHSMGGLIAPRLPELTGELLDGLILSASSAGFVNRSDEDKERYLAERVKPITEQGLSVAEYADGLLTTMMGPGAAGPLVSRVRDVVGQMKTEAFLASMRAITEYDSQPSLRSLTLPTLMVAGELDPACTAAGMRRMHDMVPGSTFHQIDGVGHYAFAEAAPEFHRVTSEFLSSLPASE